jgi:hypothetical protein
MLGIQRGKFLKCRVHHRVVQAILESPVAQVSFLLESVIMVYFIACTIMAYRIIHHVGRLRGFFIGVLGFISSALIVDPLAGTIDMALWRAFANQPS